MNLSTTDLKSPVLAMASMPVQEWCEPYDADTALKEGTIFPCLNMCFFKAPYQMENLSQEKKNIASVAAEAAAHAPVVGHSMEAKSEVSKAGCSLKAESDCNERENCMTRLAAISFVLNDLTLYLDTHPACEKALSMYHTLMKQRLDLLAEYARNYNPLTQASAITGECNPKEYGWGEGPAPWEGACV